MFKQILKKPSLTARIATGKFVGFALGIVGFILIPFAMPSAPYIFKWAILLWYPTLAAIIAIFCIYDTHPVLKIKLPWWFLSGLIGAWMNLLIVLFSYDLLHEILVSIVGLNSAFSSPLWFVFDGVISGIILEYFIKKYGGEGRVAARAEFK